MSVSLERLTYNCVLQIADWCSKTHCPHLQNLYA
jgi:hypothetical protein